MSSTNKTTNYELPQFISTDKPTWLGDFNGSMQTIDIQMKANADAGSSRSHNSKRGSHADRYDSS